MGSITEETDGGVLRRKEHTPTAVLLIKSLGNEMPGNVCACDPHVADGADHVRQRWPGCGYASSFRHRPWRGARRS
jgi:hypothetical protein